jgi:hypothetical protein
MTMLRRHVLALAAASSSGVAGPLWAQTAKPLLIEGKKTLYQRVLSRPGALLVAKPGDSGGTPVAPFTVFFVYQQVDAGGVPWLLVGAGSDGKTQGHVPAASVVPWRHMITLSFAVPTSRERVLFFRERQGLTDFVNSDGAAAESARLVKEINAKGTLGPTHPVIAAEPEKFVDLQKQFYLLPVLDAASVLLKTGHRARVVKVASVTRDAPAPAPPPTGDAGIANFNSAVVFVIDASSSMQPYIDRTRKAMEEVLRQAEAAKVSDRIRFGLVAYQDDPKRIKGLDYLAKVFADPNQVTTGAQFMTAIESLKATKLSTSSFAEDGYAALDEALRRIGWQNFGGRYIVVISDASAREGNSPFSSTKLSTEQMRAHAQERGVAIYTLHLRTPEGKADHAIAEAQYKRLSAWPGKGSLYFPVEAGDPARFEVDVKRMAQALVEQVRAPQKVLQAPSSAAPAVPADKIQDAVDAVGKAMVLAYLGRQQGVKAPPMFEAWASDRDVRNREIAAFTVRVLLTKNQLSDLQSTVRRLVEAYEKAQLDPASFFNQLRSAAVAMGRDPSRLNQGQAKNLEQAGLMGEYLEGLPYQSQLMTLDFGSWTNMSVGQTQAIIDNLKSLVVLYQRFHDDVGRWVALNPGAPDGDRVFPVPIDSLP